jgi:hypothetical protein
MSTRQSRRPFGQLGTFRLLGFVSSNRLPESNGAKQQRSPQFDAALAARSRRRDDAIGVLRRQASALENNRPGTTAYEKIRVLDLSGDEAWVTPA